MNATHAAKVKLAVFIGIAFHSGKLSLAQYWDLEEGNGQPVQ